VHGAQQRDELGRHTEAQHQLPQQLARHAIESLDQVDEEHPRLLPVLAPLP
jgi:hypothetical protein